MLKYLTATSLVALALLGCFVGQGVEAQQSSNNLNPRAIYIAPKPQTQSYQGTQSGHQTPSHQGTHSGHQTPSHQGTHSGHQTPSHQGTHSGHQTPSHQGTHSGHQTPSQSGTHSGHQTPSHQGTHSGHQTPPILGTYSGHSIPPYLGTPGIQNPIIYPWNPNKPQTSSDPRPPKPSDPRPPKPSDPRPPKPSTPRPQKPSTPSPQKPSTPSPQKPSTPRPQKPSTPSPQKPSTPSPQKPSTPRPQKPSTPKPQTSNLPNPSWTMGTKKPSYQQVQPRTSPVGQKVVQTTYEQSQGGNYQTGVTKNPNYNTCEVEESQIVQCGRLGISSSECLELGCCYDGYRCHFAKAVTVQCTKDGQFIVVVSKYSTLPSLDLNSISMLGTGSRCGPVDQNSEFAIYQFPVNECGTIVREEEPGVIVYENVLFSYLETQFGKQGGITRDTTYDLLFQGRYTATAVHSLVVELLEGTDPLPVASTGPLRVHMQLANGVCTTKGCNEVDVAYTSFYELHDYPVQKVLREPVYVQLELVERTDPFVVLTLDHCWTTTSPHPHTYPQWDILINGCPNPDDPYTAELVPVSSDVSFPGHYRRFLFYMFAFLDDVSLEPTHQQLYIHCSTSLCLAIPGSYCEPNCFRKLKKREAAATATEKTLERNVVVTAGPVIISAPSSKKE